MSNYHGRLMNIQSGNGRDYYEGHRDARHAAAEIGCEADAEIERLRRELADARDSRDHARKVTQQLERELADARGLLTAWADAHAISQRLIKETTAFLAGDQRGVAR